MKPAPKNRTKTIAKALVDDLSAVRAVVLDKQHGPSAGERATFEARLFESWVLDRLAQHECQVSAVLEELVDLREELAIRRKNLQHPAKKARKQSARDEASA